ncbi:hypothetical protein FRB96_000779 [Tulasnella sp. 330]|nr:hypothetical protein FRB96_000779 [Tulasnella sp. 330]
MPTFTTPSSPRPRWRRLPSPSNIISRISLDTLPDDILTNIALELAALYPRGPPSVVFVALGATCRSLAFALSLLSPHVYNAIFRIQFDVAALERRLCIPLVPSIVAPELVRRWRSLKRIRWAASAGSSVWGDLYPLEHIQQDMWVAYTLLLENDGKNWEQLVGWAMLRAYVHAYVDWDLTPASSAHDLPEETEVRSLGLWFLWFLSDNRNPLPEMHRHSQLQRLITPMAFSSYAPLQIRAPLLSEAALHLYFAYTQPPLVSHPTTSLVTAAPIHMPSNGISTSPSKARSDSVRFDAEWTRLTTRWDAPMPRDLPPTASGARRTYVPGSLTGIFEGIFTLPGLDTYFKVRDGEPPIESYQGSIPLSHIQAWTIEEHICVAPRATILPASKPTPSHSSTRHRHVDVSLTRLGTTPKDSGLPLRPGPPLRAHLPDKFTFDRVRTGIEASNTVNGSDAVLYNEGTTSDDEPDNEGSREIHDGDESFLEIIITGEQSIEPLQTSRNQSLMEPTSTIRGTVRRRDGLIVLHAKPLVPSSGEWIYIGRLDADGNVFTGRWRALQEDPTSHVWEGAFRMQRRSIADL